MERIIPIAAVAFLLLLLLVSSCGRSPRVNDHLAEMANRAHSHSIETARSNDRQYYQASVLAVVGPLGIAYLLFRRYAELPHNDIEMTEKLQQLKDRERTDLTISRRNRSKRRQ